MEVVLMKSTSDKRRISKNVSTIKTYTGVRLKEDTSVIDPTFVLSGVGEQHGVPVDFNYLYCEYLQRYYFVKDIRYARGGAIEIDCHVDVLMSYSQYIRNHGAYAERSEKEFYKHLDKKGSNGIFFDTEYPIRTDSYVWTEKKLEFGCVANLHSYYLTVNGGILDNL